MALLMLTKVLSQVSYCSAAIHRTVWGILCLDILSANETGPMQNDMHSTLRVYKMNTKLMPAKRKLLKKT